LLHGFNGLPCFGSGCVLDVNRVLVGLEDYHLVLDTNSLAKRQIHELVSNADKLRLIHRSILKSQGGLHGAAILSRNFGLGESSGFSSLRQHDREPAHSMPLARRISFIVQRQLEGIQEV
jgi:hypothetical protein